MVASTSQPQMTGGSTPVPDPTILTTEALLRAIADLKELLSAQLDAQDKLVNEKFRSIDQQLELVERQRVEQKMDTKAAVDAALTAQKEAVKEQTTASATAIAKSEAGTSEQLKQLAATFTAGLAGQATIITDLKDRVIKIESLKQGGTESRAGIYAAIGIAATIIGVLLAIVAFATPGGG